MAICGGGPDGLCAAVGVAAAGAGGGTGGSSDMDQEIVLKPSTTYLIKATNLSGAAKALGLWLFWYEEPVY